MIKKATKNLTSLCLLVASLGGSSALASQIEAECTFQANSWDRPQSVGFKVEFTGVWKKSFVKPGVSPDDLAGEDVFFMISDRAEVVAAEKCNEFIDQNTQWSAEEKKARKTLQHFVVHTVNSWGFPHSYDLITFNQVQKMKQYFEIKSYYPSETLPDILF